MEYSRLLREAVSSEVNLERGGEGYIPVYIFKTKNMDFVSSVYLLNENSAYSPSNQKLIC